ncbi:MAG: hypothetical protein KAI33_01785, partial [Elusimicrobiales bacterium]|nr:hypothetical protein [Elusimicrobiales bacterium]
LPVNEEQRRNQQKMSFPYSMGLLIFGCNFVSHRLQTTGVCSLFVPRFAQCLILYLIMVVEFC